jgi:hypothetical protein
VQESELLVVALICGTLQPTRSEAAVLVSKRRGATKDLVMAERKRGYKHRHRKFESCKLRHIVKRKRS